MDGNHRLSSEMKRVFLDQPLAQRMEVGGDVARHLGFSLRAAVGDLMGVADPEGNTAVAEIVHISPTRVEFVLRGRTPSPEPAVRIWLVQSLLKGDGMETVIRKATEIGTCAIVPLVAQHCIVRMEDTKASLRIARWQKVAQEAAEQSGRGMIPLIFPIVEIAKVRQTIGADAEILVLHEGCSRGLRSVLRQLQTQTKGAHSMRPLCIAVGPEGGFSAAEMDLWAETGAVSTGLGPRTLRAETAGLAALSAVFYEYGDMGDD